MSIILKAPENSILKPVIIVFGVGGAGCNAVNNMIGANLQGADYVVANTDSQSLEHSLAENQIQLGVSTTRGLGAGANPAAGEAAAEESADEIRSYIEGSNMVFITAGMGGGTGTGAAPVVAKIAKEYGILTVGVVTKPFHFEGAHRMRTAEQGLLEMQKYVDTLIVIPNQNLFRIANENTTFADAFKMADDVLHAGVRGVTDLMVMPGLINLDFADIKSVMNAMGKAMMGTGEATGEERAIQSAEAAISNPLLDNCSMKGAKGVLINITGGMDMTLFEVDAAANRIRSEVGDPDANIIFGSTFNPELEGVIRVSVVATGIDAPEDIIQNSAKESNSITPKQTTLPINNDDQDIVHSSDVEALETFDEYITTEGEEENLALYETNNGTGIHTQHNTNEEVRESTPTPTPPTPSMTTEIRGTDHVQHTHKRGPSLLGKLWQSFSSHTGHNDSSHTSSPAPNQNSHEENLYDIPTFLRKKD